MNEDESIKRCIEIFILFEKNYKSANMLTLFGVAKSQFKTYEDVLRYIENMRKH